METREAAARGALVVGSAVLWLVESPVPASYGEEPATATDD